VTCLAALTQAFKNKTKDQKIKIALRLPRMHTFAGARGDAQTLICECVDAAINAKAARALGEKCKFADSEIALAVCDYFARGPMKVIAPHPVLQKKVSKKVGCRREKQSPANAFM
jgi:hypothetical protein